MSVVFGHFRQRPSVRRKHSSYWVGFQLLALGFYPHSSHRKDWSSKSLVRTDANSWAESGKFLNKVENFRRRALCLTTIPYLNLILWSIHLWRYSSILVFLQFNWYCKPFSVSLYRSCFLCQPFLVRVSFLARKNWFVIGFVVCFLLVIWVNWFLMSSVAEMLWFLLGDWI